MKKSDYIQQVLRCSSSEDFLDMHVRGKSDNLKADLVRRCAVNPLVLSDVELNKYTDFMLGLISDVNQVEQQTVLSTYLSLALNEKKDRGTSEKFRVNLIFTNIAIAVAIVIGLLGLIH